MVIIIYGHLYISGAILASKPRQKSNPDPKYGFEFLGLIMGLG